MVPVHCVNVTNAHLLNSIKISFCSQNIANQISRSRQMLLFPPGTPEGNSSFLTVLKVSGLAVHLPLWQACAVSPWVERAVAMFTVQGPATSLSLCDKHSCKRQSSSSSEGRNRQLFIKRVLRVAPASETNKGYSRYFVVPKKGGGLCVLF